MTNAFNLSQLANNTNTSGQVALGTGVSGTLPVANGGTGAATLTTGNVVLGAGTGAVTFVAPSTSGNVLTSNGTTWTSAAGGGGGALPGMKRQIFTTAGASTFTVPTGVTQLKVSVVGGGGSGASGGLGGGGGGAAIKWITGLVPAAVIATTVGAIGGTSSFAAYCSATGGSAQGGGGLGASGDINIRGNSGTLNPSPACSVSSTGGGSLFAGGSVQASIGSPTSVTGTYGGGGSADTNSGVTKPGVSGIIVVEWIA